MREIYEARTDEAWLRQAFQRYSDSNTDWRADVKRFDAFQRGDWVVEYPDGSTKRLKPYIENRVRTIAEDKAKVAAQMFPTMRCESPSEAGTVRAQTREQLIQFYHQISSTKVKMPLLFADMLGTGIAAVKVWPDFRKPKDKRFPLFHRVDPRDVLPPPGFQVGQVADDLIVATWVKLRDLARMFPDKAELLRDKAGRRTKLSDTDEVLRIEYFASDVISSAVYHTAQGREQAGVMLYDEPNRVERCPVVLIPRPTVDGRIRGQFGDVLAALAAENRVFTLITQYIDQAVNSPIIKKGMPNQSIDLGPQGIINVPEEGDISRLAPASIDPSAFRVVADLERHSRRGMTHSEARSGDVQASIISGTAIDALQGPTITDIHSLQVQMEWGLEIANEIAQDIDREYCDARKSIVGYAQGGQFRLTYTPSEQIKPGDVSNIVTYGAGASIDKFNRIIMLLRVQQAGWASRKWAAIESGMIDNFLREENRIDDEVALDALRSGVMTRAAQGDLAPLARWRQAKEDKQNVLEVMSDIVAESLQPPGAGAPPGQPTALPGESTPGQQEAAAGTGAPGGSTALPPLSSLLLGA